MALEQFADGPTSVISARDLADRSEPTAAPPEAYLIGPLEEPGGSRRRHAVGSALLIGRDEHADIRINNDDISRSHARITRTQTGDYVLQDLESSNGSLVNGSPIQMQVLRFGDTIRLGSGVRFLFTHRSIIDEQRLATDQLASVKALASGISHHFNNLLAVLSHNIDHMISLPPDYRVGELHVREPLSDMRAALERIKVVCDQLFGVAQGGNRHQDLVDISSLLRETVTRLRRNAGGAIVEAAVDAELSAWGDKPELLHALARLGEVARDQCGEDGRLKLSAALQTPSGQSTISGPEIAILFEARPGAVREDIERYTPARTRVDSSALGAAHRVIADHGGHVEIIEDAGRLTLFICIPAAEPPVA